MFTLSALALHTAFTPYFTLPLKRDVLNFISTSSSAVLSYTGFNAAAHIPGFPDTITLTVTVCPIFASTVETVIWGFSSADMPNADNVVNISAAIKTERNLFIFLLFLFLIVKINFNLNGTILFCIYNIIIFIKIQFLD